jgi:deoxyribodipyrimidine photo-lyase
MRQLNQTGWMHNRLRMITAMYLTKNLFIDWRLGEAWFMSKLIDGFLASNNGGWQWSASTGTDAAPYFRVFNPVTQSERFDPNGDFIREWIPELAKLDSKRIHDPGAKGGVIPKGYPRQIVDLKESRKEAIAKFQELKN